MPLSSYLDSPFAWATCILAVACIGLGKGGFSGLGALATPIATLVLPPTVAVGVLLPVLISQDLVSVCTIARSGR